MILLFTPPCRAFDARSGLREKLSARVRENGGQYTHAAIWVALAFRAAT